MPLVVLDVIGVCTRIEAPCRSRRRFGVPVRGPFDAVSFSLACALLNTPFKAEVWECFGGMKAVCEDASVVVSIVGAPCEVIVGGTRSASNRSFLLNPGESLEVPSARSWGPVLVAWTPANHQFKTAKLAEPPFSLASGPIKVLPGPDGRIGDGLLESEFTVDIRSDRRGIRLIGDLAPQPPLGASIPITPGTIQLPPGGSPIIIGPDGPTIGGYPILGIVAEEDLPRLPYMKPGASVSFLVQSDEHPRNLALAHWSRLARQTAEIRAAVS